jgi:hypothetical protein
MATGTLDDLHSQTSRPCRTPINAPPLAPSPSSALGASATPSSSSALASARKDDLIELLARSKRASFEAVLAELKRDELKEICRAHGLDDAGKEKEPIIARILGREACAPRVIQPELPAARRRGRG